MGHNGPRVLAFTALAQVISTDRDTMSDKILNDGGAGSSPPRQGAGSPLQTRLSEIQTETRGASSPLRYP